MADAANVIDFHQGRGMALDAIDEALEEYRNFMLDDDYDAQGALDRIMKRLKEKREIMYDSRGEQSDG